MKTTHEPIAATEEKSGRTTLFFMALTLSALMVSAVGGGAAFMIYREFSAMPGGTQASISHSPQTTRLTRAAARTSQDGFAGTVPMNRPVAAEASDRSDFRYVDNTVLAPAAARRVIAAWRSNPVVSNVPPPLAKTDVEAAQESSNRPPLTDPESHYIVSPRTGRIIGVDGSASAVAEVHRAQAVPVAVQLPPPEVRVATAVQVRAALPVSSDDADANFQHNSGVTDGNQSVSVRRAQPAVTGRSFDAASYLASEDNVPALLGRAVVNPTSRTAGYRHDFRLPDQGSRY